MRMMVMMIMRMMTMMLTILRMKMGRMLNVDEGADDDVLMEQDHERLVMRKILMMLLIMAMMTMTGI